MASAIPRVPTAAFEGSDAVSLVLAEHGSSRRAEAIRRRHQMIPGLAIGLGNRMGDAFDGRLCMSLGRVLHLGVGAQVAKPALLRFPFAGCDPLNFRQCLPVTFGRDVGARDVVAYPRQLRESSRSYRAAAGRRDHVLQQDAGRPGLSRFKSDTWPPAASALPAPTPRSAESASAP